MKTFEVPVWFTLRAHDAKDAWQRIIQRLKEAEQYDQLPDFVVEEPVEKPQGR